jgi:hypothetical protein
VQRRYILLLVIVAASLTYSAGPATAAIKLTQEMIDMYAAVEALPPTASRMTVCYGFGCRRRMELAFTGKERATLRNILAKGRRSPAAERKAIQQAFVWFDHRVGKEVGTSKRVANADIRTFDAAHNFDCWDTTRNAMSLLLVLQDWGTLRHHTVDNPRYRGNILFGQLPHNTAVIVERKSGTKWIVDMWPTAYGQVPDVMPLAKWLEEK